MRAAVRNAIGGPELPKRSLRFRAPDAVPGPLDINGPIQYTPDV